MYLKLLLLKESLLKPLAILALIGLPFSPLQAKLELDVEVELNIEEQRVATVQKHIPDVVNRYDSSVKALEQEFSSSQNFHQANTIVINHAKKLWQTAVSDQKTDSANFDDRSLYWARLKARTVLKKADIKAGLTDEQRAILVKAFEHTSRGFSDINFSESANTIKILITGFDPFLLDRNIEQSNPSGVAALWLDSQRIEYKGKTIELETAMFPVRYQDFDDGMVEKVVRPYLANNSIDMLVTISMGRSDFDLEHFPGKRRSSSAPGNLNVYSGGSQENPIIPNLGTKPQQGPEFVLFSLPYEAMMQVQTPYKVNDNRTVTTLEKTFAPNSLEELDGATAVEGGGGGYLSNEISYRTINLGNKLNTTVPTGHIHTPRISEFNQAEVKAIVEQIKDMLIHGVIQ